MVNENGVFEDNIEILFAKVTAADVPRVICENACRRSYYKANSANVFTIGFDLETAKEDIKVSE
ncbi:hypothetical protein DAPPUDRAFT_321998 [Daphnia pulex]|uniref:Uncharacterized protein n=1 Tax=Daphnia pulex TaxID=6669 RepID=E9GUV1_DAPPU|nr:hypothetical protein DAPPUDRAFT_321998 [Daphnia pulex]|eukprot:EFX76802.1 hypothetical protein DAPPUDRAFT_321998 [Daphnia pulex]